MFFVNPILYPNFAFFLGKSCWKCRTNIVFFLCINGELLVYCKGISIKYYGICCLLSFTMLCHELVLSKITHFLGYKIFSSNFVHVKI